MNKDKKNSNALEELIQELVKNLSACIKIFVEKIIPKIIDNTMIAYKNKNLKLLFLNNKSDYSKKDIDTLKPFDPIECTFGYMPKIKKHLFFDDLDTSKHCLTVGASGSGKSNFINGLMEKSAYKDTPVLHIDPKGALEELNNFIELAKKYKRKFYIFDPSYNGNEKIYLNPFKTMEPKAIAANLVDIFEYSNEFYKNVARNSITEVISVIAETNLEDWNEEMFQLRKKMEVKFRNNTNEINLKKILFGLKYLFSEKKDYFGVIGDVETLNNGSLGEMLSDSKIYETKCLSEIIEENAWVYIGLNKQKYGSEAQSMGKLFFQECLYISGDRQQKSLNPIIDFKPVTIIIEEFSSLVTKQLPELTSKARSSGFQIVLALQSLSDSDNVAGINSLKEIIMDHVGLLIIFNQRDPKNAEILSSAIGTTESKKETKQTDNSSETERGSSREVEKFLVHPNLIKGLPRGTCFIIDFSVNKKNVILLQVRNFKLGEIKYKKSILVAGKEIHLSCENEKFYPRKEPSEIKNLEIHNSFK